LDSNHSNALRAAIAKMKTTAHFTADISRKIVYRPRRYNTVLCRQPLECALLPRRQLAALLTRCGADMLVRMRDATPGTW
jgi:hypothetical protein